MLEYSHGDLDESVLLFDECCLRKAFAASMFITKIYIYISIIVSQTPKT